MKPEQEAEYCKQFAQLYRLSTRELMDLTKADASLQDIVDHVMLWQAQDWLEKRKGEMWLAERGLAKAREHIDWRNAELRPASSRNQV